MKISYLQVAAMLVGLAIMGCSSTTSDRESSSDVVIQNQPKITVKKKEQLAAVGSGKEVKTLSQPEVQAKPKVTVESSRQHAMQDAVRSKLQPLQKDSAVAAAPVARLAEKKAGGVMPLARLSPSAAAPMGFANGVPPQWRAPSEELDRENYQHFDDNPLKLVSEHPVSTFSIDVDTGSYTNTRRIIKSGQLPRHDAVRVEEFINYFHYNYPAPRSLKVPFNVVTELGPTPWSSNTRLLQIGIKGYEVPKQNLPPANLVFLIDVSGSMQSANKLGLLVNSLKLLTSQLRAEDRISIVVYAGASGVILEPVSGQEKQKILAALDSLSAGGSTNGAAGIRAAYNMAEQGFIKNGINRVILATDGDFNVGTVNFDTLKNMVADKRKSGVSLTTLGFGAGNYNDKLMEQLADVGNGNYAYIDTLQEAQKVLVDEMGSTLKTIAKDVKIQIEFNPSVVSEYRLIGYENRALKREDFNNDKVDAGDIGAGHTVTALYEITLANSGVQHVDPLRYQPSKKSAVVGEHNEIAYLRLRYKQPNSDSSKLIERPIKLDEMKASLAATSGRYRFVASVAAFGQVLRGGKYTGKYDCADVLKLARQSRGKDEFGYRSEFIQLVNLASTLAQPVAHNEQAEHEIRKVE